MVDLVVPPAGVLRSSGGAMQHVFAGAAINAGQVVALDTASGLYQLASAASANADLRKAAGIALNNAAAANQPLSISTSGRITIGGAMTPGIGYYVSATAGGLCPRADLVTGNYVCLVGLSASATDLDLGIQYAGVQV